MVQEDIKKQILEKLSERLDLYKVILFGSFAYGSPEGESDIDLLVVTDDNDMPKNFHENIEKYLKVSSALGDLKKHISIDLIVHTKPMHEKFLHLGSMFSRVIMEKGEVLYQKDI